MIKAEKGIIELELEIINNNLTNIKITGDFFFHPEDALEELENRLNNTKADLKIIEEKISKMYYEKKLTTPGITLNNWLEVFDKAIES